VATYVIETYLSREHADRLPETVDRLREAVESRPNRGTVRYVRSVFIPEDETCFHVIEATSAETVRDLTRRATITAERIVEATALDSTLGP